MSRYILLSPNGSLSLEVMLNGGALSYCVVKDAVVLIEDSPIGAVLEHVDLTCGLTALQEMHGAIDETYTLPAFKKNLCINKCNTLSINLEKDGYPMTLECRAYDDGAAFRMVFHKEEIMKGETTGFCIP